MAQGVRLARPPRDTWWGRLGRPSRLDEAVDDRGRLSAARRFGPGVVPAPEDGTAQAALAIEVAGPQDLGDVPLPSLLRGGLYGIVMIDQPPISGFKSNSDGTL